MSLEDIVLAFKPLLMRSAPGPRGQHDEGRQGWGHDAADSLQDQITEVTQYVLTGRSKFKPETIASLERACAAGPEALREWVKIRYTGERLAYERNLYGTRTVRVTERDWRGERVEVEQRVTNYPDSLNAPIGNDEQDPSRADVLPADAPAEQTANVGKYGAMARGKLRAEPRLTPIVERLAELDAQLGLDARGRSAEALDKRSTEYREAVAERGRLVAALERNVFPIEGGDNGKN